MSLPPHPLIGARSMAMCHFHFDRESCQLFLAQSNPGGAGGTAQGESRAQLNQKMRKKGSCAILTWLRARAEFNVEDPFGALHPSSESPQTLTRL